MPLKEDWVTGDSYAATDQNAVAAQVNANTTGIAAKPDDLADLGVTASAAELNHVDGVTSPIQTQLGGKQPLDTDLTTIAALTATTDNVIQSVGSAWASRTPAQVKATLALAKGDVGLGNVTNNAQYYAGGTDVPITDGGTGVSTLPSGLLKGAGTGAITAGSAGTDYVAPSGALGTPSSGNISNCLGVPYDLSIVGFGAATTRAASSYGDFPFGVKLQRAISMTSVTFRVATADASGNLVCQLRKNDTLISGTSTTIAAASQVAGGTSTGTWAAAAGDIITVYVTGIGTTVGKGLIADIKAVTA